MAADPDPIPHTDDLVTRRQFFYEFFGTFVLVYIGGLAVMQSDLKKIDNTGVALAHTFVIAFMVWSGGGISGAHYNGGVSLGLLVSRHIGFKKFLLYQLAQYMGSFAAGAV